jgi:hypothetical protein
MQQTNITATCIHPLQTAPAIYRLLRSNREDGAYNQYQTSTKFCSSLSACLALSGVQFASLYMDGFGWQEGLALVDCSQKSLGSRYGDD